VVQVQVQVHQLAVQELLIKVMQVQGDKLVIHIVQVAVAVLMLLALLVQLLVMVAMALQLQLLAHLLLTQAAVAVVWKVMALQAQVELAVVVKVDQPITVEQLQVVQTLVAQVVAEQQ
jgi:hypothetical protein